MLLLLLPWASGLAFEMVTKQVRFMALSIVGQLFQRSRVVRVVLVDDLKVMGVCQTSRTGTDRPIGVPKQMAHKGAGIGREGNAQIDETRHDGQL